MNGLDVLRKAQRLIERKGLAYGCAKDTKGRYCTAAAIVESSYVDEKFKEAAYVEARRFLASSLAIAPTYQGIVDWNDAHRLTKDGTTIQYRTVKEVIEAFKKAIEQAEAIAVV